MISKKLLNWQYYYTKLPLYIRNDFGIPEQFKMIHELICKLDSVEDEILNCFNLMQYNYENKVIAKYDNINGYDFKLLDIIASIYGINRYMNVSYYSNIENTDINKSLKLTNKELYLLIKSRIIQNNYDGSYQQALEYYNDIDLPIYMFTDQMSPLHCQLYLGLNDNIKNNENMRTLFLANILTLKSVGIVYIVNELDITKIAIWADNTELVSTNNQFDLSIWA